MTNKEYYENNKEKIAESGKLYYENNKEKIKKYYENNKEKIMTRQKKYYENNKEKIKKYYENNKEKIAESGKLYRENNKEKVAESNKLYRENNKEKAKLYRENNKENNKEKIRLYEKNRKLIDPLFKLKCNIRSLIWTSITRQNYTKRSRTYKILGCSFEDFKTYLENQFTDGMNWENQGKWHMDHIYPVSLATDEKHLIELNHYTNFQPLWAIDNIKKSNKKSPN